jgi:5S rRNA maturation endonuclease (ribonuclease M5)
MQESAKYLIHATVEADGVVERSDVVGAVFGQTEGLLGDRMDLRRLKDSSKVGRIHVDVDSEAGRSRGELTIASDLDRVETAVLAASLETIDRVGPCRSDVTVTGIEDVRAAKRRTVVDRAKELLSSGFDESVPSTDELLEEVRQSARVEDVTDYEGLPAGPNVATSDAIVVVEGRADVLRLLKYGIKNAIAVEGTDVPDAVVDLTRERTVTAFFDGDRGGDLILEELSQVGAVDYVAVAPPGKPVEELDRHEVMTTLREKVPYEELDAVDGSVVAATDGSVRPAPGNDQADAPGSTGGDDEGPASGADPNGPEVEQAEPPRDHPEAQVAAGAVATDRDVEAADGVAAEQDADQADGVAAEAVDGSVPDDADAAGDATPAPETVQGHVEAVVGGGTGTVRLLDEAAGVLAEGPVGETFARVEEADPVPEIVVMDGRLDQRVLDVAAQRGVRQVVAHELGDFVKQPTNVRIRTAEQVLAS